MVYLSQKCQAKDLLNQQPPPALHQKEENKIKKSIIPLIMLFYWDFDKECFLTPNEKII